jgi:hypothetical protein
MRPKAYFAREILRRIVRMGQVDPACSQSSPFFMGQDSQGNWVVQDQAGDCGGIFVDRTTALKFAMFESGDQPRPVIMVPGVFELDMKRGADNVHRLPRDIGRQHNRRAA